MKKKQDGGVMVSSTSGHVSAIMGGETWKISRTMEKSCGDIKKSILVYEIVFTNKGGVLTMTSERISDAVREALL